jgi:hypothetical protein
MRKAFRGQLFVNLESKKTIINLMKFHRVNRRFIKLYRTYKILQIVRFKNE